MDEQAAEVRPFDTAAWPRSVPLKWFDSGCSVEGMFFLKNHGRPSVMAAFFEYFHGKIFVKNKNNRNHNENFSVGV